MKLLYVFVFVLFESSIFALGNIILFDMEVNYLLFCSDDQEFRCPTAGLFARPGVQADNEYIECDGPDQLGKLRYCDYPEIWNDESKSCIYA